MLGAVRGPEMVPRGWAQTTDYPESKPSSQGETRLWGVLWWKRKASEVRTLEHISIGGQRGRVKEREGGETPRINFGVLSNQHSLTKMSLLGEEWAGVSTWTSTFTQSAVHLGSRCGGCDTHRQSPGWFCVLGVFYPLCLKNISGMPPITNWNLPLLCFISWAAGFLWGHVVFLLPLYHTNFK